MGVNFMDLHQRHSRIWSMTLLTVEHDTVVCGLSVPPVRCITVGWYSRRFWWPWTACYTTTQLWSSLSAAVSTYSISSSYVTISSVKWSKLYFMCTVDSYWTPLIFHHSKLHVFLWSFLFRYLSTLCRCEQPVGMHQLEQFPKVNNPSEMLYNKFWVVITRALSYLGWYCDLWQGVELLSYLYQETTESINTDNYPMMLSILQTSCGPYNL